MASVDQRYARFAWGVLAFNLFVILWGAFVRATGSGAGCGSHWPLCNGEIVPRDPAAATLIEFGHRVTSGIALLLVGALVAGAWRRFPRRHRVRLAATLAGVFMLSEALVGAGLVLFRMVADNPSLARGAWMAGHLVNTYLLIAALALTAFSASRSSPPPAVRSPGAPAATLLVGLAGLLVLGVSGAITALGDTLFPAASLDEARAQMLSETAHLFVRLRLWHPTLAVVVGAWVLFAVLYSTAGRPGRTPARLAAATTGLYLAQVLLGGLNVWFLAPVGLQLAHLLVSDLIWIALVLLTAEVFGAPAAAGTSPHPVGAPAG